MPGVGVIEATVRFGDKVQYTFNDVLGTLTHHRGWKQPCSYVIIELNNPHTDIINEFMNHGKITVKYGKDGDYSGPFTFEIVNIANAVEFSSVKVRVFAVEPGFIRLTEQDDIKSYPNQTVSGVVSQMAREAGMNTVGIKPTTGTYTFIKPNMDNMLFLSEYMLPIATDAARSAPYLFTIDNNVVHFRPPDLKQEPNFKFRLDSSKENVIKRFTVRNNGTETDFITGTTYKTYGYDFIKKGSLTHQDYTKSVNQSFLSRKPYESGYSRTRVMPYPEQWMLDAHNRNELARAQFTVSSDTVIVGENEFNFDQIYQFTNLALDREPTEYSGKHYSYSIVNTLKRRFFVTHMYFYTNSYLKGEKSPAPGPEQQGPRPITPALAQRIA